jgi:N-acetylated-alpha-linked acidic dipeptidase
MELGFDGDYGVYHSTYDDFYWMNHFGDPGYRYHTLMSQLWGVLALRLANADILPFDFASYARNIRQFLADMSNNKDMGQLDLKAVAAEIDEFETAGKKLNESIATALATGTADPQLVATLNRGLMQVERNWLNPDGIPGRPWFKHILYGARYTYAHLELPGLTEATEARDWTTARQQAAILQRALSNNIKLLEELNSDLGAGKTSHMLLPGSLENRNQFPGEKQSRKQ